MYIKINMQLSKALFHYMYMLQVKIKFWLKVFNLGWF